MNPQYSEEELAGLTDEERAALEENDDMPEEEDVDEDEVLGRKPKADDKSSDEAGDDGDSDAEDDKDDDEQDDSKDKGDDAGADDPDKDDEEKPVVRRDAPDNPLLKYEDLADADVKLQAIEDSRGKLNEQFDDGDMTHAEYRQQMKELDKQERDIERAQFKAELATELQQSSQQNDWQRSVSRFLGEHGEYQQNPMRYQALDAAVRSVAARDDSAELTGDEILAKAHQELTEAFGAAPTPDNVNDDKEAGKRKPREQLPPNLSRLPAAESDKPGEGKFAALERMMKEDPERAEEIMAKMSDSELDEFSQYA